VSYLTYLRSYPMSFYSPQTGNLPLLVQSVTHFVPFLVLGSASSGTVIRRAPYQNWTLCGWSHFRYRALPVPVRTFIRPGTGTGLYASDPISGTGLCQFRYGRLSGPVPELDSMRVAAQELGGRAALLLIFLGIGSYREALLLIFVECAAEGGSASLIFGCKRDPFTETVRDCTCAEPENEENEPSTQYWKWDFPLPVMLPVLEMGGPLPVLVNCTFWDLLYTAPASRGLRVHSRWGDSRLLDGCLISYTGILSPCWSGSL
jgi:hypothetical protein